MPRGAVAFVPVRSSGPIIPGWYGKMPSLGDFSQRGLSPAFVSRWDHWLAQCLLASREALGDAWLDLYLTSPIWRFLLLSGVAGESLWAGVLMPSVDRVGRYFPLTLAAEIPADGPAPDPARAAPWFSELETIAIATLEEGLTAEALADRLAQHPFPMPAGALAAQAEDLAATLRGARPARLDLPSLDAIPDLMTATAARMLLAQGAGMSLWWSQPGQEASSLLLCHRGLPDATDYVEMISPEVRAA